MRARQQNRRGSAILIALIFSAAAMLIIMSQTRSIVQQYKSTVRYGLAQTAFHLSESGLELGMHAIAEEQLGTTDWPASGSNAWVYNSSETIYANYTALLTVAVVLGNDGIYTVTALTGIDLSGQMVESAVEIEVAQEHSDTEEQNNTGAGVFGYGLVAKNSIKINHSNPGAKIASYNSNLDNGVPNFGVNTGYDAVIATLSSNNYAININNSYINGAVRSGGGNIGYNSGFNNPNQQDQNATVIGPDSGMQYGVDPDRMSKDFDGEITDPELPTSDGYNVQNYTDQNYWQNTSHITLGSWSTPTWINTERITTKNNGTTRILGDVVLNVQRNLNLHADIVIEPGATLTIMAGENIHVTGNSEQQHPAQFQLIAKGNPWGGPTVNIKSKIFTGIVNAPSSKVELHGSNNPRHQFRGSVVAKEIDVTNGTEIYDDTALGNSGDNGPGDGGGEAVGDLSLLRWSEIPPAQAKATLYSL